MSDVQVIRLALKPSFFPTRRSLCSLHSWINMQMAISHADNTQHKPPLTSPRNDHSDRVAASANWRGPPGDLIRDLLALPARLGGISMPNPSKTSNKEYASSLLISEPLRDLILSKNPSYPIGVMPSPRMPASKRRPTDSTAQQFCPRPQT